MFKNPLFTMKLSASMMPMRKPEATMAGMMGTKMSPRHLMARLKRGLLRRGGGLHLLLGGGGEAGDLEKFVVDLVDGAGAQNQLELAVGAEHALNPLHVFQSLHVDFPVVHRHQAKPRGAVGRADQVLPPAEMAEDLPRALSVIHCHSRFLPLSEIDVSCEINFT